MTASVEPWIRALRSGGAIGVDGFEAKLMSHGTNHQKVFELLSEARAAVLFLSNGWKVTMRERPDLYLQLGSHEIYAEVKHVHEKETDKRDQEAMAAAEPFQFVNV